MSQLGWSQPLSLPACFPSQNFLLHSVTQHRFILDFYIFANCLILDTGAPSGDLKLCVTRYMLVPYSSGLMFGSVAVLPSAPLLWRRLTGFILLAGLRALQHTIAPPSLDKQNFVLPLQGNDRLSSHCRLPPFTATGSFFHFPGHCHSQNFLGTRGGGPHALPRGTNLTWECGFLGTLGRFRRRILLAAGVLGLMALLLARLLSGLGTHGEAHSLKHRCRTMPQFFLPSGFTTGSIGVLLALLPCSDV